MMATQPGDIDAASFADWLHSHVQRFGRETVRARLRCGGEALGELLAMVPGDEIALSTVDRCLVRMDTGDSLATLYPDLDASTGRVDRGRSYVCDERLLLLGHRMHMDGMSARGVAREIFDDCYSASPKALANALLGAWHGRGWEVRSRSEATALSNVQRAWRPQCAHVVHGGHRKGERCERRCVGNDATCWKHDPERIAAGVARLRGAA